MDTARQVVRWSIPGSVLLIVALAVDVMSRLFERLHGARGPLISVGSSAVALFALATIPLGYLVYQLYYSREGRIRRFPRSMVPIDRGHMILWSLDLQVRQAALDRLGGPGFDPDLFTVHTAPTGESVQTSRDGNWVWWPAQRLQKLRLGIGHQRLTVESQRPRLPSEWKRRLNPWDGFYADRRHRRAGYYFASQRHLLLLRTLLAVIAKDDQGKALAAEYTSLSDIYHGLGATRTALALGVVAGFCVRLLTPGRSLGSLVLAVVCVGGASAAVYACVHANRGEVLRRLIGTAHHGLTYVLRSQDAADEESLTAQAPTGTVPSATAPVNGVPAPA